MTRTLVTLLGAVPLLSACGPLPMQDQSRAVIGACLEELQNLAGRSLSSDADRAYVYAKENRYRVYFAHGDVGTFGRRSPDYRVLLACGAVYDTPPEMVFMGEPMKAPLLDQPGRDYFVTPSGSTELLFIRKEGRFEYCCSQPFRRTNLIIYNPSL